MGLGVKIVKKLGLALARPNNVFIKKQGGEMLIRFLLLTVNLL